jgi:predicted nucleotidyltransferase
MKNKEIQSFCKENNIELLILFGSHASGETDPASDIDVAIKFKWGNEISKLELIYKLDDLFNGRSIDLVVLTADTDPLLLYEIFFNGRSLYEEDQGIFEKEKLRAWKLYLDTEKLRVMQKQYLKKFVEKVSDVT